MRKPRPQDFDPDYQKPTSPKPEMVDMTGVIALKPKEETKGQSESPTKHDAMPPRNHDTTVSRYHDTVVEAVRKAVKEFGKEAATHRFTEQEKRVIADIIYMYKQQDIRTNENEITRIAVNFIIQDYKEFGENSILDRVLKALNE
jgi:hypothetical protein